MGLYGIGRGVGVLLRHVGDLRFLRSASEGARCPGIIVYGDQEQPRTGSPASSTGSQFSQVPVQKLMPRARIPQWRAASVYYKALDDSTERQTRASSSVPNSRVVSWRAAHYIFMSNEADTLRETRDSLPAMKLAGACIKKGGRLDVDSVRWNQIKQSTRAGDDVFSPESRGFVPLGAGPGVDLSNGGDVAMTAALTAVPFSHRAWASGKNSSA